MKDNFSIQAAEYAKFRPGYPKELFEYLISLVPAHKQAWDCGTGNGQVAAELSDYFEKVFATDISENQLKNAVRKENIIYKVESAEQTSFADNQFDLITVAQAIHWFDFDKFYTEVKRTLKPNGILAVIGYPLFRADAKIDNIIVTFYNDIIGTYWDKERRYIDEEYRTIPFPFKELKPPEFKIEYEWNLEQMIGYLNTWSAVQHYIKQNGKNPVDLIINDLKNVWGNQITKTVRFPTLLRIGRK